MKTTINVNGKIIDLKTPKIMGILNITPDSFYENSRVKEIVDILERAKKMLDEGATFLDIGGYSSRPNATHIDENEEIKRVVEPIKEIRKAFPQAIISIDTFRSKVAELAINSGANIVNDISGGHYDTEMANFVGSNQLVYIGMHMRGTPQNMTQLTNYENVILEINHYFSEMIDKFTSKGCKDIIIDPGIGFAKSIPQSYDIIKNLELLQINEKPILIGVSRKSMIFKTLNITQKEALNGTTILNTLALQKGAKILRVHDVAPAIEIIKILDTIN